jgi:hypothetical protein
MSAVFSCIILGREVAMSSYVQSKQDLPTLSADRRGFCAGSAARFGKGLKKMQIGVMKNALTQLLWIMLLLGGPRAHAKYFGELKTTWDSLPMLKLPALGNMLYDNVEVIVAHIPIGAYANLVSTDPCVNRCKLSWSEVNTGTVRLKICNVFGYGAEFAPCNSEVRIEFGIQQMGVQKLHCTLPLQLMGSRILPKVRIGAITSEIVPPLNFEAPDIAYVYPQLEILFPRNGAKIWVKPRWKAQIEVIDHPPFWVEGWNDCNGITTCTACRAPCKPMPFPMSWVKKSNGLIKITFDPHVIVPTCGGDVQLQFESDSLSFWYDVEEDKRVER